jgi:glycine betaine/proline transport system ATP-binding protein
MDITGASTSNVHETRISVKSLWKVFGNNPNQVLTAEHSGKSKDEVLEELRCVIALQDVNFEVPSGETFVVMGLSGSGKSTLIRCLIRLVEPTAGEIRIDDEDILKYRGKQLTQFRRKKVAMVFQHFGLLPHRTIIDNVAWGLEVQGMAKKERLIVAQEVIEQVGLKGWEQSYSTELSGGMQQRVGLARALAVNPEILLMDEPFSALDPLIRREMQDEMLLLQERIKKTIVFITHDLDEALKLGDRIAIMRDGKIIQLGIPEEIVHSPADSYVEEFTQGVSKTRLMGAASIMLDPDVVVFPWQGPRIALRAMKTHDWAHAFVVDSSKKLRGIITEDQAATAVAQGITSFLGTDLINPDICPIVSPDTSIDDLLPLAAETRCPIAVVNDEGQLLGVVSRGSLLSSLAEDKRMQPSEENTSIA